MVIDRFLEQFYAQSSGDIVFVDESFSLEAAQPFYSMAFAVVERNLLRVTRAALSEFNAGHTLHGSELFRSRRLKTLRSALDLVAKQNDGAVVVVRKSIGQSNVLMEAREECLQLGLMELYESVSVIVLDRNKDERLNELDRQIIRNLKLANRLPREFRQTHAFANREPLLGLPDMIAWAFRQDFLGVNSDWFDPLRDSTKVIEL